jgi:hypothetical protein
MKNIVAISAESKYPFQKQDSLKLFAAWGNACNLFCSGFLSFLHLQCLQSLGCFGKRAELKGHPASIWTAPDKFGC